MPTTTTQVTQDLTVTVVEISSPTARAVLTDFGARLLELHVPDRDGVLADVVLQRADLSELPGDDTFMGSTAGRYANRVRGGRFTLAGQEVRLSTNEGGNHLHGGTSGFDQKTWSHELAADGSGVRFQRTSPAGEEGYPGTLETSVTYRLQGSDLWIEIEATTDATTIVNIVNHSYVNLAGHDSGDVLGQQLTLHAGYYLPVDDDLLPTGEVRSVAGTPFDFRTPTEIGRHVAEVGGSGAGRVSDGALGFDHNWVLEGTGLRPALELVDPVSGRRLRTATDQPGVQVYTGGYLEGVSAKGPTGHYVKHAGLTMETQHFPDSPNTSHFPSPVLTPGQTYRNTVHLAFDTVGRRAEVTGVDEE